MRYHIDTIPVWDALKQGSECLLCALRRQTELKLLERSLGASVMSPDVRIHVNQAGFCRHHQAMLYDFPDGNRLGHALMMLSHLQTVLPKVEKALFRGDKPGGKNPSGSLRFLPRKAAQSPRPPESLAGLSSRCVICDELDRQSERQAASLLHLWKTEAAFREAFSQSKGLCVPDMARMLSMAPEMLGGETLASFTSSLATLLKNSLNGLEQDLSWYTQKFDYRNADKPWGNSKDALERTVNKLRGWCLGGEPTQDDKA